MNLRQLHYGWVLVIISVIILAAIGFTFYPFGVFIKPLTTEFGWDRGALSGALSVSIIIGGVLGIVSGRLSDRYGPRPMITIGGLLCGIAFLLLSLVSALWHVYLILGIILGTGSVLRNIDTPPSGGCRTSVELEMDDIADTRDVKGFHQLFIYGDLELPFKAYCQLAGIEVVHI